MGLSWEQDFPGIIRLSWEQDIPGTAEKYFFPVFSCLQEIPGIVQSHLTAWKKSWDYLRKSWDFSRTNSWDFSGIPGIVPGLLVHFLHGYATFSH
jgi:hypothetical protein